MGDVDRSGSSISHSFDTESQRRGGTKKNKRRIQVEEDGGL